MKTLIAIFGVTIGSVMIFCHLFKRMLNGFDVPDGDVEFWEWIERTENVSDS